MLKVICPSCNAQPCQCWEYRAAREAHRLLVIEPRPELRDKPGAVWRYKLAIGVGLDAHVETIKMLTDDGSTVAIPKKGTA